MTDPLIALIAGILIIGFLSYIFWPNFGLSDKLKRWTQDTERVQIEDALKHLYDCEYRNISCTINSIAGNLSINADRAAKLVSRLEALGLLAIQGEVLQLTAQGRSYALRIIRVHRLWERYLADETSTKELDWHDIAEKQEHLFTPEQADKLAAQIGNPVYDPHGDPIPSSKGDLPTKKGKPLNEMLPGEFANIIHIEDEPPAIYSQILAQGLYPGMQIRVLEVSDKRIKFEANGEECVLSPIIAKNITVGIIQLEKQVEGKYKVLSSLKVGEKGTVLGIAKALRGQQRRRLMDLGIVPGTEIEAQLESLNRDPVAYKVRGAVIAIRKQQADRIYLESKESEKG
ncbi:MAG: metal-dependent transcriptional regulator [Ignavibacteriaceae bacterium]|nr:metal-dependent transcriptional regulator [Ignavibacteriaceae bacterium]